MFAAWLLFRRPACQWSLAFGCSALGGQVGQAALCGALGVVGCLPVLRARLPTLGADLLAALNTVCEGLPCAAREASALPSGFNRPTWQELWDGVRCRVSRETSSAATSLTDDCVVRAAAVAGLRDVAHSRGASAD